MAVYKGLASVGVESLDSTRNWALTSDAAWVGGNAFADQTGWEANAGVKVTLTFRTWTTGLAPPPTADTAFELIVYWGTGTTNLIKTLYSSTTAPADGTQYDFYMTSTGNQGSPLRAGTLRLYIRAQAGGVSAYNRNSDGTGGSGLAATNVHQGVIRSNCIVDNVTASAYPAGSTFAYGVTANEQVTLSANFTQPYVTLAGSGASLNALDGTAIQIVGSGQTLSSTSLNQAFTVNNTFKDLAQAYGCRVSSHGDSPISPTSGSIRWSAMKAGTGLTQFDATSVDKAAFYNVDPRISMSAVTPSETLYNRGEASSSQFTVSNARAEAISRLLQCQLKDSLGTVKKTDNLSGNPKNMTYTIAASDDAANDLVGNQWTVNTIIGDVDTQKSGNTFKVSSKLVLESISTPFAVYNRGESVTYTANLNYARGTDYANLTTITASVSAADMSTEDNVSNETTDATGTLVHVYTVDALDQATADAVGSPKSVQFQHSGNDTGVLSGGWGVSNLLKTATLYHGKTDTDANTDFIPDDPNETDFFVGADVLYTKCQIQNIRDENYENAAVTIQVLRNNSQEESDTGSVTTANGWMDLFYTHNVIAPAGERTVRYIASKDGNSVTTDATISYAPSYTGNLGMTPACDFLDDDSDKSVRVVIQPYKLKTDNTRQKLSVAGATVDTAPKATLLRYEDDGAMTEAQAETIMTNIGSDDDWEITYSSLADGYYSVEIAMTVDGGQITQSLVFAVGRPTPKFDATGLFR